jgi:RNA polymerase sigma-70 factor (ECF subfamily)
MSLAARFLAHSGSARDALAAAPDLEALLAQLVATARAAWPGIIVEDDAFLRHVAERLPGEGGPREALAALHAGDLYLACACAVGEPRALAAFEKQFLSQVDAYLARTEGQAGMAEEVRQALRTRLLVGDGDRPPRIASFTGQGPLGGWLRMATARVAVDLHRASKRESGRESSLPSAPGDAPDPELEYLKLRWRPELEAAFESTLAALGAQEANVLRLYFLNGVTAEAIGTLYQVSSRTVQRWIVDTRQRILHETRKRLAERLEMSVSQIDTVMGLVQSQIDVNLPGLLGRPSGD